MEINLNIKPKFKIGQKVYISKKFGNCKYLERYDADEVTVENIKIEYNVKFKQLDILYGLVETDYWTSERSLFATKDALYETYLQEIKQLLPTGMQNYLKENL